MNDKLAKAEDEISNLQRILAEKDDIIEMQRKELSDKVETLKAAKDILEKDANSMKEQLVVLKEKVSELQQDIFNPRSFVNCLQGKNQKLQQDLENLQRQVIQGQQELKKLQTKYDETVGELTTKQQIMKGDDRARTQQSPQFLQSELDEERRIADVLRQQNEQLKNENAALVKELRHKCGNACVLDIICWVCTHLGADSLLGADEPCRRALERILFSTYLVAEKRNITPEDLKCTQLMEVLLKLGVVEKHNTFQYPPGWDSKLAGPREAWETIMRMGRTELFVILGRLGLGSEPNGKGHCVLCSLEERADGKIIIYDPQKGSAAEKERIGDQDDFIKYLWNDAGMTLFTVNIVKLQEIINDYLKIHVSSCTGEAPASFPPATGTLD